MSCLSDYQRLWGVLDWGWGERRDVDDLNFIHDVRVNETKEERKSLEWLPLRVGLQEVSVWISICLRRSRRIISEKKTDLHSIRKRSRPTEKTRSSLSLPMSSTEKKNFIYPSRRSLLLLVREDRVMFFSSLMRILVEYSSSSLLARNSPEEIACFLLSRWHQAQTRNTSEWCLCSFFLSLSVCQAVRWRDQRCFPMWHRSLMRRRQISIYGWRSFSVSFWPAFVLWGWLVRTWHFPCD